MHEIDGNSRVLWVRAGSACKAQETSVGSLDALQALLASSSSAEGGAALRFAGNVQFLWIVAMNGLSVKIPARLRGRSLAG